jgi:DNA-binding NarL/FixJ family response regulator
MPLLLLTQDKELEERCRRAASAEYSITVTSALDPLLSLIPQIKPQVVLIDADVLERPYGDKITGVLATPGVGRVIVMTAEFIEDEEVAFLRLGVQGCCRRGIDPDSLRQVLSVTESGVWVTHSLLQRLVKELRRYAPAQSAEEVAKTPQVKEPPVLERVSDEKLTGLTPRERDIVKLIASGASNKKVAEELDITERTVKGHLSNVFMKLGVNDRLKLVLLLKGVQEPGGEHAKALRR